MLQGDIQHCKYLSSGAIRTAFLASCTPNGGCILHAGEFGLLEPFTVVSFGVLTTVLTWPSLQPYYKPRMVGLYSIQIFYCILPVACWLKPNMSIVNARRQKDCLLFRTGF